ncbi:response regulator transcription factor [Neobacillus sp. WH10]|uniref:response regulator transcription factor n=1 Tax=Neobacillus sp. WH10 TaxID=3047873 RepID=UPI0024C193D1|nr:response regulator transcription factor [Neobacillus sp. WH10]WHY77015.1 response regulator transcription factor [Neobacillus sp. WH10]
MKIKVIIADDNSFIREGLKIILNTYAEFEVLDTVNDGKEAIDFCLKHPVDIALLDVRMPNMNGVEAAKLITEQTSVKPIILTTFDDDEYILDAIKNGAKGYLLKNNDPEQIRDAIKSVYNGNSIIQDVILEKIKSNLTEHKAPETPTDLSQFTDREREIMSLIAKGCSNKAISKQVFISEGTVANYITSILNKTGLEHRTQIAIFYLKGKVE